MKGLLYLALLIVMYFAFTSGLKFCYNGQCHEVKIEVLNK